MGLCAATGPSIKIWDLESKSVVDDLKPEVISMSGSKDKAASCISLAWSSWPNLICWLHGQSHPSMAGYENVSIMSCENMKKILKILKNPTKKKKKKKKKK